MCPLAGRGPRSTCSSAVPGVIHMHVSMWNEHAVLFKPCTLNDSSKYNCACVHPGWLDTAFHPAHQAHGTALVSRCQFRLWLSGCRRVVDGLIWAMWKCCQTVETLEHGRRWTLVGVVTDLQHECGQQPVRRLLAWFVLS